MRNRTAGFTLVELMVVVLVIGILVAIAVPVFNAAKASAEQSTCFANQRTLEGVYQQYLQAGGAQTCYMTYLVSAGYLKKEPVCPSWARDTAHRYFYYFHPAALGQVLTHRTNLDGSEIEGFPGCLAPPDGHGYYRDPEVN